MHKYSKISPTYGLTNSGIILSSSILRIGFEQMNCEAERVGSL